MRIATIALVLSACIGAQAQTGIHACQAEAAIQKVYGQSRGSPNRISILRDALSANSDDLFLNRWLIESPDVRRGGLAAEYEAKLTAHPGEPLFLYLYGWRWWAKTLLKRPG